MLRDPSRGEAQSLRGHRSAGAADMSEMHSGGLLVEAIISPQPFATRFVILATPLRRARESRHSGILQRSHHSIPGPACGAVGVSAQHLLHLREEVLP